MIIDSYTNKKLQGDTKDTVFSRNPFSEHNYPMFSRITNGRRFSLIKEKDAKNANDLISMGYLLDSQREYADAILNSVKGNTLDQSFVNQLKIIHENMNKITNQPEEIIMKQIFASSIKEMLSLCATNKQVRTICERNEDYIFKHFLKKEFPMFIKYKYNKSYKDFYKMILYLMTKVYAVPIRIIYFLVEYRFKYSYMSDSDFFNKYFKEHQRIYFENSSIYNPEYATLKSAKIPETIMSFYLERFFSTNENYINYDIYNRLSISDKEIAIQKTLEAVTSRVGQGLDKFTSKIDWGSWTDTDATEMVHHFCQTTGILV